MERPLLASMRLGWDCAVERLAARTGLFWGVGLLMASVEITVGAGVQGLTN